MIQQIKILLLALTVSFSFIQTVAAQDTMSDDQKIATITELLKENPKLIDDFLYSLNHYIGQDKTIQNTLTEYQDFIFNNLAHSRYGSKQTKLTLINFTDYDCPFCKRLEPVLAELAKNIEGLEVINIYVPLKQNKLKGISTNAAHYALNVWQNDPQSFQQVNDLLIKKSGLHNQRSLQKTAELTGTEDFLESNEQAKETLANNLQLFRKLGLQGTPGMIIVDQSDPDYQTLQVIPGYMPLETLQPIIEEAIKAQ